MSNYVMVYYGEPHFESREAGANYRADWEAWAAGIGDAFVNPGTYLEAASSVRSGDVSDTNSSTRLTGFSIVKADSMDAAIEIAKGCPHTRHGKIDVAKAMEM